MDILMLSPSLCKGAGTTATLQKMKFSIRVCQIAVRGRGESENLLGEGRFLTIRTFFKAKNSFL